MKTDEVVEMVRELGIPHIHHYASKNVFLCKGEEAIEAESCVLLRWLDDSWQIYRDVYGLPLGYLICTVDNAFDLQDWLINEFDKYRT